MSDDPKPDLTPPSFVLPGVAATRTAESHLSGKIEKAQWSINATTLISMGGAVLTFIASMLIGGWFIMHEARAEGRAGGQEAVVPLLPLIPRVTFLEATIPFTLSEVRLTREELRAAIEKGAWAPELKRPMAPLPVLLDGGHP